MGIFGSKKKDAESVEDSDGSGFVSKNDLERTESESRSKRNDVIAEKASFEQKKRSKSGRSGKSSSSRRERRPEKIHLLDQEPGPPMWQYLYCTSLMIAILVTFRNLLLGLYIGNLSGIKIALLFIGLVASSLMLYMFNRLGKKHEKDAAVKQVKGH